ncbi:MAG: tetratricopeptide repeat protein [Bacteroidales bacterium]
MKKIFIVVVLCVVFITSCNNRNQTSDTENKLEALNEQIKKDSKNPELYLQRAVYYQHNNSLDAALEDVEKAVELDPKNTNAYLLMSSVYITMGKAQSAIDAINKGLSVNRDNIDLLLSKAELFFIMKDKKQCLETIETIVNIEPNTAKAYTIKGLLEMENEETNEAINSFQKAIEINPKEYDALIQLGFIFQNIDINISADYFKTTAKLFPDKIEPRYDLAMIYQQEEKPYEAIEMYKEILQIDSTNSNAYYNVGYVYLTMLNDFDKSIEFFSKCIHYDNTNANAYYNRGYSYELLGNIEEAKVNYEKVLSLETNNELAIGGLNRLDELE